jgi:hypothetical protein
VKKTIIASLIPLALSLTPFTVLADPMGLSVKVACPGSTGTKSVANFGSYIAGYGLETIQPVGTSAPYFKSETMPGNVPADLRSYHNSNASYDSTTGKVVCGYISKNAGEPGIAVSYVLTNGKGGLIVSIETDSVNLLLPLGKN